MNEKVYIIATTRPWNIQAFEKYTPEMNGKWFLATNPKELDALLVRLSKPRYIFFPHWSWKVPPAVHEQYECVCFHMTDVPYGRGGSPLQNLISRGVETTRLTALKMVEEMDAGPVYYKKPLSLDGSAQDIFERAVDPVYEMISCIADKEPLPVEQAGEPVFFARRTPQQSEMPERGSIKELYDHTRMLDAISYPKAFLHYGDWHLEFTEASIHGDVVTAKVVIRKNESGTS